MLICCKCFAINKSDSCNEVRIRNEKSHFVQEGVTYKGLADFLYLFYETIFPYNNTRSYNVFCRTAPISKDNANGRSFLLTDSIAIRYLKFNTTDLRYNYFDRDLGDFSSVKNDIYANNAYSLKDKYIVLSYAVEHYSTESYDNQEFLVVMNKDGEIISNICVVGDTIKRYSYNSFVIVDETNFKVYNYSVNIENVKDKEDYGEGLYVKYIDDEMPKTKCVITDYIITDDGHIAKVRVNEPIMLNHDCWNYIDNDTPLVEDDPILEY